MKKKLSHYAGAFIVGIVITLIVLMTRDIFELVLWKDIYKALSDGFSATGLVLILFGLLLTVSSEGAFYGLVFAVKSVIEVMKPRYRRTGQTYYDYVEGKKAEGKPSFTFMFIVGAFYLAIGILFTVLYYGV